MTDALPTVTLLSRQVAHYHHARFSAAGRLLPKCDVLSLANQGNFDEMLSTAQPEGYRVHRIYPDRESYLAAAARGAVMSDISERLDDIGPEVVAIAGWASPESFAALNWARRHRRGVVVMSDSRVEDASRNVVREFIKSRIVRSCDAALVAGGRHRDYICSLGMPEDRVRLGYDAVDNAYFEARSDTARAQDETLRQEFGLPRRYILASCRFIDKKNVERIIEAYWQACYGLDGPPDLLIAGDGVNRPLLEAASMKLRGECRVHLPGFFSYDVLPSLYGLAEGFVHIPTYEQWGLVVNEAAAAGLPLVISQECGAATELVQQGSNGWLVPADDTSAVATALRKVMTLGTSERAAMGRASRAIVAEWGPERFASELVATALFARTSQKKLSLFDRVIIRTMSRRVVGTVK